MDLSNFFEEMGFSEERCSSIISSGYVTSKYTSTIIDRFHGGPLLSADQRTRFSPEYFHNIVNGENCFPRRPPFPLFHAKSMAGVKESVAEIQTSNPAMNLCFRGQTSHHKLGRKLVNPNFDHPELGETSLIPSVWRLLLKAAPSCFPQFDGLSMIEWGAILYKLWPMEEIHAREKSLQEKGEWLFTISDMEECSDELLRDFGKFRGDLNLEEAIFQGGLLTMMQHYGLPSPFLDLTTDLEVATFFATHKFKMADDIATYNFIGTNQRQSIIYVLSVGEGDMHKHERNKVMKMAKPARPYRQSCVVCSTNAWSINLPADYLVGAIILDHDMDQPSRYCTGDLFPSPNEDPFLEAWASTDSYSITLF